MRFFIIQVNGLNSFYNCGSETKPLLHSHIIAPWLSLCGVRPNTDHYDSSFGWCKLEKDPLICVGSPDTQSVTGTETHSEEACSHFVHLHQDDSFSQTARVDKTVCMLKHCWKTNTHVVLKLREGFANAILQEDHSLPVGPPLGREVKALADSVVQEGGRGGAVDVAAGQGGDGGRSVYVEWSGGKKQDEWQVRRQTTMASYWGKSRHGLYGSSSSSYKSWSLSQYQRNSAILIIMCGQSDLCWKVCVHLLCYQHQNFQFVCDEKSE